MTYQWARETESEPASVGQIFPWGGIPILYVSDEVPEGERDELAEKVCNLLNKNAEETKVVLPPNCRENLRMNLKPYPKSGCDVCGNGGLHGCPYKRGK